MFYSKNKCSQLIGLTLLLFLFGILFSGCIGADNFQAQGWSGPTASEEAVFANSQTGRLIAFDKINRNQNWQFKPEEESPSMSLFSCGGATTKPLVTYGTPVISDGTLFVGSYGGKLYAVDVETGVNKWEFDTTGPIVGSVSISNGNVIVGSTNGKVYALDTQNGTLKWNVPYSTGGIIWSDLVIDGDYLYVGDLEHKLHVLDINSGELVWDKEFDGAIASTPLIVDGTIFIGSFDSKFYALDASTGIEKWAAPFQAKSWFWTTALVNDHTVYAGSLDGNLYALNANTGQVKWTKNTGGGIRSAAVMINDVLIVASNNGKVLGLDPGSGNEKWAPRNLDAPVLANIWPDDGNVYIVDQKNTLHSIEATTGQETWSISLEEESGN